jgi:hypothetical protein
VNQDPELTLSEIPSSVCPFCGQDFLRAAHVTDGVRPGMLCLCPKCMEVMEIGGPYASRAICLI